MADQKSLIAWATKNSERLNLKLSVGKWPQRSLPDYSDVRASITLDGRRFLGSGWSNSFDQSATIAIAEAIERAVCFQNGLPTSGSAIHADLESAKRNAYRELIERDLLLCHFLTTTPLIFREDAQKKYDICRRAKEFCSLQNVEISFYQTFRAHDGAAYICLARGIRSSRPFNSIFGFGFNQSERLALENAVGECLANVMAWISRVSMITHSARSFKDLQSPAPVDHRGYYLGFDSTSIVDRLFNSTTSTDCPLKPIEYDYTFTEIRSTSPLLLSAPLVCIKCSSPQLQTSFYGLPAESDLNLSRLASFSGCHISLSNMPPDPHFVG